MQGSTARLARAPPGERLDPRARRVVPTPRVSPRKAGVSCGRRAVPAVCAAGSGPVVGGAAAASSIYGNAAKMASLMSTTDSWRLLKAHATEDEMPHLRELLADVKRCEKMFAEFDGITLDYSRQARAPPRSRRRPAGPKKGTQAWSSRPWLRRRAWPAGGREPRAGAMPRRPGRARRPPRASRPQLRALTRCAALAPSCVHAQHSARLRAPCRCCSSWRRRPRCRRRLRRCLRGST
jgi:hypothetical protein